MKNEFFTSVKSGESGSMQSSFSYDKSFTVGLSCLLGIISFGMITLQSMRGTIASTTDTHSLNSATFAYPDIQLSSYRIQFPGLAPLVVSSAIAYQSGNPVMALLGSSPLWLSAEVNAQGLPALIDFNTTLPSNLGFMLQGNAVGDYVGQAVAGAGDVNGDNKSDFLIGAYLASPEGRKSAGAAYLIYGAANLPATIDLGNLKTGQGVVLQGGANNDEAGIFVAGAGDVNDDGKSDFLIAAQYASPNGKSRAGAAYLIYGTASLPSSINLGNLTENVGVVLQGGAAYDEAGSAIASAGDVNQDGKSDFLIGADGADPLGRSSAGESYLIYGAASLPSVINLGNLTMERGIKLQGGAKGDNFGIAVAGTGDINDDGGWDFLVGANGASPGGRTGAGSVYVIYGQPSLTMKSVTTPGQISSTTPRGVTQQNTGATQSIMAPSISGTTDANNQPGSVSLTTLESTPAITIGSPVSSVMRDVTRPFFTMPAETTENTSTTSTPTIIGGVVGSVVVISVALAACGFWRKKHKPVSVTSDTEKSFDNYSGNRPVDPNNSGYGSLKSVDNSSDKYEIPKSYPQQNNPAPSVGAIYGRIDETKNAARQYDHAPVAMVDDLKMSH